MIETTNQRMTLAHDWSMTKKNNNFTWSDNEMKKENEKQHDKKNPNLFTSSGLSLWL